MKFSDGAVCDFYLASLLRLQRQPSRQISRRGLQTGHKLEAHISSFTGCK